MKTVIAVMWASLTAITYGVGFGSVLPTASVDAAHIPESGVLTLVGILMIATAHRVRRSLSS